MGTCFSEENQDSFNKEERTELSAIVIKVLTEVRGENVIKDQQAQPAIFLSITVIHGPRIRNPLCPGSGLCMYL